MAIGVGEGALGLEEAEFAHGTVVGAFPAEGHVLEADAFRGVRFVTGGQNGGPLVIPAGGGEALAGEFFKDAVGANPVAIGVVVGSRNIGHQALEIAGRDSGRTPGERFRRVRFGCK